MGSAASRPLDDRIKAGTFDARRMNKLITQEIEEEKKKEENHYRLLLLGTGNCGKSTFCKQFQLLHLKQGLGDMQGYKNAVSMNIITGIHKAIRIASENGSFSSSPMNASLVEALHKNNEATIWDQIDVDGKQLKVSQVVQGIWENRSIQLACSNSSNLIEEPVSYFMSRIDDVELDSYVPTNADVLRIRTRTCGVREVTTDMGGAQVTLIDVGGQRSQRRKWIGYFAGVSAILYIASLGEFDCPLLEDPTTNRLIDALENFSLIVKHPLLVKANFVLLLNKKDVMREKINNGTDLKTVFPKYRGESGDYKRAVSHVQNVFYTTYNNRYMQGTTNTTHGNDGFLQIHRTVGINTSNAKVIFECCKQILFRNSVKGFQYE